VLWLDLEQDCYLTCEVLSEAGARGEAHEVYVFNGLAPNDRQILATVCARKPVAVVVDSLSRFLQLSDENDASQMNKGLQVLLRVARELRCSVLAIHHDRKTDGSSGRNMRGSSALGAAADLSIEVRRSGDSSPRRDLRMTSRYRVPEELGITLGDSGYDISGGPEYIKEDELLVGLYGGPLTTEEWAKKQGMTRQGLASRARDLHASGKILRTGTGRRSDPYRFSLPVGFQKLGEDF
jgi:hypothetical protein